MGFSQIITLCPSHFLTHPCRNFMNVSKVTSKLHNFFPFPMLFLFSFIYTAEPKVFCFCMVATCPFFFSHFPPPSLFSPASASLIFLFPSLASLSLPSCPLPTSLVTISLLFPLLFALLEWWICSKGQIHLPGHT